MIAYPMTTGRNFDEILLDSKKLDQRVERSRKFAQAGGYGRLQFLFRELFTLRAKKPSEI